MSRPNDFHVELIATGNEILFGRLLDTNSAWIVKNLTEDGARVKRITCIGDDIQDIRGVIQESLARKPDLIITTGGLGPSFDDRTIEAIASAVSKEIVLNENALKMLKNGFKKRSQRRGGSSKLPPRLRKMAYLIEGSEPIENPVGLAPGIKLMVEKTLIIALPGVPNEMKTIFKRFLSPLIKEATGRRIAAMSLRVKVERGTLTSIIKEFLETNPNMYLKTYAGDITPHSGIKIDIMAQGETIEESETVLKATFKELKKIVEEKDGVLTLID